jgi:dTDP-4-amino-4,6-dideoxygalactose transaminase
MEQLSNRQIELNLIGLPNKYNPIEKFKNHKIDCVVHYNTLINNESLYQTLGTYSKSDYLKLTSFTVPNQHTLTDNEVERIAKALQ